MDLVPNWIEYAIFDEDGSYGMENLGLIEDAPDWAKEAYEDFWKEQEVLREKGVKV